MTVVVLEAGYPMLTGDHPACGDAPAAAFFARAARGLARDPRVVGSAIAAYRERHTRTEAELTVWLGLANVIALHQLALCTRPDPAGASFDDEVEALARYFGGDREHLRALLATPTD